MNFASTTLWVVSDVQKLPFKTMTIIEPCCTSKIIPVLLARIGSTGTEFWHGYADLMLTDILSPVIAGYDKGVDITLITPRVPSFLTEALRSLIAQGCISQLSILTDARGDMGKSVTSLAMQFPNRITLSSRLVSDTLLLFPDTAWWGNIGHGGEYIGMVTRNHTIIEGLRKEWSEVIARYKIS